MFEAAGNVDRHIHIYGFHNGSTTHHTPRSPITLFQATTCDVAHLPSLDFCETATTSYLRSIDLTASDLTHWRATTANWSQETSSQSSDNYNEG